MTTIGQLCLLVAMVGSGYAAFTAFAAPVGRPFQAVTLRRTGIWAAVTAVLALTAATALLAWALLVKDFRFAYVVQYSSRQLPWYYSLSAAWVGQAGSLLLWAWLLGVLALIFRMRGADPLRNTAFGIVAAYLCFLVAVMVFGADPMAPSIGGPQDGAGLGPLLQHPIMLIHPPVVFLGYACSAFPFALAIAALLSGHIDAGWPRQMRSWALATWTILGVGILLGADWAYEELGWGGYWGWDPVENSSLIPWLTGTALLHTAMAWRRRGVLKKSTLLLAIATLGLCNFAAFVTRSGIFSSVHEFSRSPIGWMFLALLGVMAAAGGILVFIRRRLLIPDRPIESIWARESLLVHSGTVLTLLAAITLVGTVTGVLTGIVFGRKIILGPEFYNAALIPIGLVLLAATALAPLTRWGLAPSRAQRGMLILSAGAGIVAAAIAFALGARHPITLAVTALTALAVAALLVPLVVPPLGGVFRNKPAEQRGRESFSMSAFGSTGGTLPLTADMEKDPRPLPPEAGTTNPRRPVPRLTYSSSLIHLGFVCLVIGISGSSLGTAKHEAVLDEGQTIQWAGRSIRLARVIQREDAGRLIVEAQVEVSRSSHTAFTVLPAQHLHRAHNEWTTEVAIHSTWAEDFYVIVHGGEAQSKVHLTFVVNPMMRWLWLGGWIAGVGALGALLSVRRRKSGQSVVPAPHGAVLARSRVCEV